MQKSPQLDFNARHSPSHDQMLSIAAPAIPINYTSAAYSGPSSNYSIHAQVANSTSPQFTNQTSQTHDAHVGNSPYQPNIYESAGSAVAIPQVVGSGPTSGPQGSEFVLHLTSPTDLTSDPRPLKVMFGSKRMTGEIEKTQDSQGYPQFSLTVKVPNMASCGWFEAKTPVYFNVEDSEGNELHTEQIADFTYTDAPIYTTSPPPNEMHKRKASQEERFDASRGEPKRMAMQPDVKLHKDDDYSAYSYPPAVANTQQYSSYNQSAADRTYPGYYEQNSRPVNANINSRPYTSSSYDSPDLSYAQTTPNQSWNGSVYHSSPQTMGSAINQPQLANSMTGAQDGVQPALVRTSTIQMHNAPQPGGNGSYNPYAVMPHKAVLKLNGNLDGMAEAWGEDEWQNRRRLVQFWRRQKGATIQTDFSPVSQSDRQANSICISCIWWAEKNAAYVTSVDCIYLLESLIAVRFTVEEKNRIRRNLEGFHPLTVSKAKPDSEHFFKLIMGFPNPKPRNIEKDVKVFPWKVLTLALKKIIGKYSATYTSPTSMISPAPSAYLDPNDNRPGSSGLAGSPHSNASSLPHHGMDSPKYIQHRSPMNRNTPPVHHQGSGLPAPPPPNMWHHQQLPQPSQQAPRSGWDAGMNHRGSVDISAYLDTSPVTASNPAYQHQRPQDNGRGSHQIRNGL